jgi:hypothetical protein
MARSCPSPIETRTSAAFFTFFLTLFDGNNYNSVTSSVRTQEVFFSCYHKVSPLKLDLKYFNWVLEQLVG